MVPNYDYIGHKYLSIYYYYGYICQFLIMFLAQVDSLKCVHSKNTQDFKYRPILMAYKWLRNQNGRIQLPYGVHCNEYSIFIIDIPFLS